MTGFRLDENVSYDLREELARQLSDADIYAVGDGIAPPKQTPDPDILRITQILHGKRAITADTALRLGRWLGTCVELWLNLQKAYELRRAEQEVGPEIVRTIAPRQIPGSEPG